MFKINTKINQNTVDRTQNSVKAIIITLTEMRGRKRKQPTLESCKSFKKLVQHRGEKAEVDILVDLKEIMNII